MDPVLYKAAMEGDIEVVKQMADQFEVQLTPNNNTVLHVAAHFGQTQCVKEVLKKSSRSQLCSVNIDGETSLHISARKGHTDIVRALIGHGKTLESDPESGIGATMEMLRTRNVEGDTALFEAVRNNHLSVVEILTKEDPDFLHFPNSAKETPLYLAAERHNLCIVSNILENFNSPAYIGPNERTALHAATICDDAECIEMLHDWKPSLIKEADVNGWRPLHYAAFLGNTSKILLLLDKDKSAAYLVADNDNNKTALHIAASQGHIDVMEALLLSCPDCWEMNNSKDQNILHIAIENDREEEIIEFILAKPFLSSLLNQKDIDGNTPLHLLAAKSSKYLYDKRVCNKKNLTASEVRFGDLNPYQMALHIAASQGHIDAMEDLLLSCPDCWKMKNSKDQNILHIAIENDWEEEIIAFILVNPFLSSLLNQKDIDGNTPLHLLAAKSSKHYLYDLTIINLPSVDKMVCNKKNLTSSAIRYGDLNPYQARMMGSRKTNSILGSLGRTAAESNLVVATLTATVSFAAGFTIPGGYEVNDGPNKGLAVLTRRAAFNVFVLADAIALIFSISTVFVHIFASSFEDEDVRMLGQGLALSCILYAMIAMVIAFITGLYAVLPNSSGIAISVVVICSLYFFSGLFYGFFLTKFSHNLRVGRFQSRFRGYFRQRNIKVIF